MERRVSIPLIALAALLSSRLALAGPPFLTDDPEPVEYRHWEAYAFSTYDRTTAATATLGPALELNLGAAPDLQLHLVVPWAWNHAAGSSSRSGWGDLELGLKFRLVGETADRPQLGVFPMVELPAGNATRGLGNGQAWVKVPFWIQKSWGPWTTYGGAGWAVNHAPGQLDHAFGGWLLQRNFGESLTLGGEVYVQAAQAEDERGFTIANLGGMINFKPGMALLFSGGASVHGQRHTVAYLGLYWTWGPPHP